MSNKNRNTKNVALSLDTSASPLSLDDNNMEKTEAMFSRLTKLMADTFSTSMKQMIDVLEGKFTTLVNIQGSEVFSISARIDTLERKLETSLTSNAALSSQIRSLESENAALRTAVENLDQYSRADNLIIQGVPLPPPGQEENLYEEVPSILNKLIPGVDLRPGSFSVIHRLPTPTSAGMPSTMGSKPPAIVMKFVRRHTRQLLLAKRRLLKGKQIVLSEHLSPSRAALLKKASLMVANNKLTSSWSQDGKVLIKTLQNRTVQIFADVDLDQFR